MLMLFRKILILGVVLFFIFSTSGTGITKEVSQYRARTVAQNWLHHLTESHGFGNSRFIPPEVKIISEEVMVYKNRVVGYNFILSPRGHIIVPFRDELPPVKLYSNTVTLRMADNSDVAEWIKEELFKTYEALDSKRQELAYVDFSSTHNGRLWSLFDVDSSSFPNEYKSATTGMEFLSLGPLLSTTWDQGDPYNTYCPLGYTNVAGIWSLTAQGVSVGCTEYTPCQTNPPYLCGTDICGSFQMGDPDIHVMQSGGIFLTSEEDGNGNHFDLTGAISSDGVNFTIQGSGITPGIGNATTTYTGTLDGNIISGSFSGFASWTYEDKNGNLITETATWTGTFTVTIERYVTGCVATAAAQIMKYWNYPVSGRGSTSYTWNNGVSNQTLSRDFSLSTYQWGLMKNNHTSGDTAAEKDAVARLMSDIGIAFNMDYGTASQGGSGANTLYGTTVYPTYFKYKSTISAVYRTSYASDSAWMKVFRDEVQNSRPSQLRIRDPNAGGHSVVVDGYRDSPSEQIHINLGWSGYYDGWYIPNNIVAGGYNFSDVNYQAAVIGIEPVSSGIGDFDGDKKSDVLWQQTTSGTVAIWFMNGATIASVGVPGAVGSDWQIKGVGDFDGDSKADILWQHTPTGTVAIWFMNGATIASVGVPGAVGSDWQIKGIGDFDGDGRADILWQHTSGAVAIWLMNGTTISSVGVPGAVGSDWQIKGVGDFDGDGKADILWQHTSGAVAIWLMNGTTIGSVGVPGAVGSDWQIKGVGDFNGDGKADILWQHTSGTVAIWLMNGLTIASNGVGVPGAVGSDWQIKGVGDFDGDGKADILWRHTSGAVAIWLMNGLTIASVGVPGAAGSDWQIKN